MHGLKRWTGRRRASGGGRERRRRDRRRRRLADRSLGVSVVCLASARSRRGRADRWRRLRTPGSGSTPRNPTLRSARGKRGCRRDSGWAVYQGARRPVAPRTGRAHRRTTPAQSLIPPLRMIHLTRSLVRRWLDSLLHIDDSPQRTAAAFALGVFFGFSPLLGLHTILALAFAFVLNLNRVAALLGVYANLPWIIGPYYAIATM